MAKGNFRASWHDYRSRAKYMITLKKADSIPSFGDLAGGVENPHLLLSRTGTHVRDAIGNLRNICDSIRIWQYIVMPDHIHFLINVEDVLDEPLGNYLARMKADANDRCGDFVFQPGFNDQIITAQRSLDVIFQYIGSNPYRLAVRRAHPDYFTRVNDIEIAGLRCRAYGNMNLLQNPFKDQVVCHRRDSEELHSSNSERWLYTAANGGVLVSPFIAKREKDIREAAENLNSKIILISDHRLNDREKPAKHDFGQCEQGRLLILTPSGLPTTSKRDICLAMNDFAARVAACPPELILAR